MNALSTKVDQHNNNEEFYSGFTSEKLLGFKRNLWEQISELEEIYAKKPMTEFYDENNFMSTKWRISEVKSIDWSRYLSPSKDNLPLLLLLKITVYHYVQVLKKDGNIFVGNIKKFIDIFGSRMAIENILTGEKNNLFIPASIINEDKISGWTKDAIQSKELTSPAALDILEKVASIPVNKLYGLKFLKITTTFPWKNLKGSNGLTKRQHYINSLLGSKATRTLTKSYKPFSQEVCAKILDFSIPIVTEHADTLKELFQVANDPKYKQANNQKMFTAEGRDKILEQKDVLLKVLPYKLHGGYQLNNGYFNELYDIVQAASLWIILFTTALRNVDVRENLLRQCYLKDEESELLYYLLTDIKKTKQENFTIPVPKLTIDAIDFLNSINIAPETCSNLLIRRTLVRGGKTAKTWHYTGGQQVGSLLRKMANLLNVDLLDGLEVDDNEEGVAHRCRATMAGWIGTNSPLAVLIIRRLFGHTNGVMPDHYLKHNVHVQAERRAIQRQTYIKTSDEFAESIISGNISGGIKNSLESGKKQLENLIVLEAKQNNESLTQGEIRLRLKERIADVLFKRLYQGEILGLQTPLAYVCMRNPLSAIDSPCSINSSKQQRINKEIDKSFASSLQMTGLPELDNCKGPLCQHSFLYDNPLTKILLEQFRYYTTYLQGINKSAVNLDIEAKNFINLYSVPLSEVYPDVMKNMSKNNNLE
jgi:hypothetical protein